MKLKTALYFQHAFTDTKKMKNLTVLFSILIMLSVSAANADDFQARAGDYISGTLLSHPAQYALSVPVVFALSQPTGCRLCAEQTSDCRLYVEQTSPHNGVIRWLPKFLVCHGISLDVSDSISIQETRLQGLTKYLGTFSAEFRIKKDIVFPK